MGMFDSYKYERMPKLEKGFYWVELADVEIGESKKSGRPMIVLTVRPNVNPSMRVKDFIVQNEYFNANVSSVCDCFGVEPDDSRIMTWPGAVGVVYLKEDGDFMKVGRYIHREEVNKIKDLKPWEGPMPERQEVNSIPRASTTEDEDELPF